MAADLSRVTTRTVGPDEAGLRLDRWFKRRYPGLGFGRLARLLRTGQVRVDGRRAKPGLRLAAGQEVRVPPLPAEAGEAAAARPAASVAEADREALRRAVLFRDDWVIAVDKPAGLATQGGSRVRVSLDAMLEALAGPGEPRPHLVHRLDKDTSGVLLLARGPEAARRLGAALRGRTAEKLYWAAVAGVPRPRGGRIELALAKAGRSGGEKMAADAAAGKPAVTLYRTVAAAGRRAAWLALAPLTGRTHQLRAHCAALGTPILGDGKYGGRAAFPKTLPEVGQLHLHAREIAVPHPDDGTTLRVTAPLPAHMATTFAVLGFREADGEGVRPGADEA